MWCPMDNRILSWEGNLVDVIGAIVLRCGREGDAPALVIDYQVFSAAIGAGEQQLSQTVCLEISGRRAPFSREWRNR
jgi:hypothetical protein